MFFVYLEKVPGKNFRGHLILDIMSAVVRILFIQLTIGSNAPPNPLLSSQIHLSRSKDLWVKLHVVK